MKIKSFTTQMLRLKSSAIEYIEQTIKRNGEILLNPNDVDETFIVSVYNRHSQRVDIFVCAIKTDRIVGRWDDGDEDEEFSIFDCTDDSIPFIADLVASHYGELNTSTF